MSEREPAYSGGEPCPRTRIGTICLLRVKKTAVTQRTVLGRLKTSV